jgi:hypothetical protein
MKKLIMAFVLIVLVAGCKEFHFDDFQPGKDGGTSYPFITEIPATPEHLNGGWMHTWYILDASLQLTTSSHFIGAYPIYNGNDGQDGADGQDGLTPHIDDDGYWWIGEFRTDIRAEGINGLDGSPGADGLTPYINEETGTWWIGDYNTGALTQGEAGSDGTNGLTPYVGENGNWWVGDTDTGASSTGADGTNGDGISVSIIEGYWYVWNTITQSFVNTYVSSSGTPGTDGTNGTDGVGVDYITEEPSPNCGELTGVKVTIHLTDGSSYYFSVCNGADGLPVPPDDCVSDSPFCSGAYTINNRNVIDEGFNNESVPYASGWTSSGSFYGFIDDHLVVKGRKTPNEAVLITPDLQLANLTEIRVEGFEYQKDHHKFVRAWVLDTEGNWTMLDKKELTVHYKKDRDPQILTWNTFIENVTNIKFTFQSDSGDKDDPISHDESKVVIDKIIINGDEVTCVENDC